MCEERFRIDDEPVLEGYCVIHDNKKKFVFPALKRKDCYMFCKALNQLNDEIEYLEFDNELLDECSNKYGRWCYDLLKENNELKLENRQLKEGGGE